MFSTIVKKIFFKLLIDPLKYGKKNDYNATKYWHDRFSKYGDSIKGPGNESISEEENWKMYEDAKSVFLTTCQKENISFKSLSFCEIGLGIGFYTQILKDQNVNHYKGYDISDVLIPKMSKKFPEFSFEQKDISTDLLNNNFDVILLIDVIQHIVNKEKFRFTLNNIVSHLSNNGRFIFGPLEKRNSKPLYYVRGWTITDVKKVIPEDTYYISEPIQFRGSHLHIIRKK